MTKSGDALRDTAQQLTSRFVHNYEAHLRLALHEEAANTAIRIIELSRWRAERDYRNVRSFRRYILKKSLDG